MKSLFLTTLLALCTAAPAIAQCNTFDCAYKEAQRLLNSTEKDKYTKAMAHLEDAENFAGGDKGQYEKVRALRKKAFVAIEGERKEAVEARLAVDKAAEGANSLSKQVEDEHLNSLKIYRKYSDLERRINEDSTNRYILLFWSTWDKPSFRSLTLFDTLSTHEKLAKTKMLLVTLDFESQIKKLLPFLEKRQLKCEVVLLTDQDANHWIPKVSEDWDGTVPATAIIRPNAKNIMHVGEFENYEALLNFFKK